MKEKFLWGGIIIAVLCWIGNYVYFQSQQLEEPIFMDHYYETHISEHSMLKFYYLTNKNFTAQVNYVDINGIECYPMPEGSGFMIWDNNFNHRTPRYEQEFTHQYLKAVTIELPPPPIPVKEDPNGVWSFNKMTVHFSNGQTVTADIGRVNIYPPLQKQIGLNSKMSSSSNQHRGGNSLVATEDITVEDISVPFTKIIPDNTALKINLDQDKLKQLEQVMNGEDPPVWTSDDTDKDWEEVRGISVHDGIFPLPLKAGEWMQLLMQFNPKHSGYFEFDIKLKGRTDSGKQFEYLVPINDQPDYNQKVIKEIIAAKQGGYSNE